MKNRGRIKMERNISLTSRYYKMFELEHINVIQLDKTHQKHTRFNADCNRAHTWENMEYLSQNNKKNTRKIWSMVG